jgi:hypothetical protein
MLKYADHASNNGMHPTANSVAFIENLSVITLCARRVMPSVRPLIESSLTTPYSSIMSISTISSGGEE